MRAKTGALARAAAATHPSPDPRRFVARQLYDGGAAADGRILTERLSPPGDI